MDGGASASSPYAAPRADIGGYASTPVYEGHVVYAGFWKRVAAYLIDYLLTSVVGGMVGMVIGVAAGGAGLADDASGMMALQVVSGLVGFAISLVYFSGFHASSLQATPGKLAIGIKVTRGDGSTNIVEVKRLNSGKEDAFKNNASAAATQILEYSQRQGVPHQGGVIRLDATGVAVNESPETINRWLNGALNGRIGEGQIRYVEVLTSDGRALRFQAQNGWLVPMQ